MKSASLLDPLAFPSVRNENTTSFNASLNVGQNVTINKTVTVSAGPATSSKVDVYFLADETGSMGSYISTVKSAAASILSSTAGLGDVAFAVGGYRDQDSSSGIGYRLLTNLTTNTTTAQTAINNWATDVGGDLPEADLFALQQAASTTSWRAGSERILVWFGDAPGHDPSFGVTEGAATAALVANGIAVQAVSVGVNNLDQTGQATRITTATGGALYSGINTASLVATITNAISTAVDTYTTVGLDLTDAPAGVSVTAVPPSFSGTYDRSVQRTFNFAVTFTGVTAGAYSFDIYGTVDGGRVATERDSITVSGTRSVPDGGSTFVLLGGVLAAMGFVKRRSHRA